jgi:hypothetical protein
MMSEVENVQHVVFLPTVEILREQFESLQYFSKETLLPHDKDALMNVVNEGEQQMMQLAMEMMFVNKLNTIARNIEWVHGHSYSPFKAKFFKEKLTNPATEADQFGNVSKWGMKMLPEEWALYEELYNELFQHEVIDDSSN